MRQAGFSILENFEPVDAAEMFLVTGHQWQSPVNRGRRDENVIVSEMNSVVPEYTRYLAGIPANFPIQRDDCVRTQSCSAVFLLFFRKALSKLSHRNYTDIKRYVRMIQQEARGTSSLSLSCLAFQVNEKRCIEKHQPLFLSLQRLAELLGRLCTSSSRCSALAFISCPLERRSSSAGSKSFPVCTDSGMIARRTTLENDSRESRFARFSLS